MGVTHMGILKQPRVEGTLKSAICKNWPSLKIILQTSRGQYFTRDEMLTAANLAQLAMQLAVRTGSSEWYFERKQAGSSWFHVNIISYLQLNTFMSLIYHQYCFTFW